MADQTLLTNFYDIDNLVNVDIEMAAADWGKVRLTNPHFAWRGNPNWMNPPTTKEIIDKYYGHRYDYFATTAVTISGSKYPAKQRFTSVWIVKKSFGGLKSETKPSIKLEFGRITKEMKDKSSEADKRLAKKTKNDALALIGTSHLTLNNCIQDDSYIKQPLGYEIFRPGKSRSRDAPSTTMTRGIFTRQRPGSTLRRRA